MRKIFAVFLAVLFSLTYTRAMADSVLQINVGNTAAVGSYVADKDFSTPTWSGISFVTTPIDTSHVPNPAPQEVYETQRYSSDLLYTIPNLTPGTKYLVRNHFAETYWSAPNSRIFNILINGVTVETNFDIFVKAGGANIAFVKEYLTTVPANGNITVEMIASKDNASLAALELIPEDVFVTPSPTPVPTVAPTATPTAVPTATPTAVPTATPTPVPTANGFPIYTNMFTGKTPFHDTVAQLKAAGAKVLSSTVSNNYWAEGIGTAQPYNTSAGTGPMFDVHQGDASYAMVCKAYGTCTANGKVFHFPNGATPSQGSDHHITSEDNVYAHGETTGWGGYGPNCQNVSGAVTPTSSCPHPCDLEPGNNGNPGTLNCSWGGFYPYGGSGLANPPGESGTAGGYAYGLMAITAGELLQGHIDHALGITESCLDNNGIYPSTPGRGTDAVCPGNLEPNARYGDMIHLKDGVDVTKINSDKYCQVVLTAFNKYGAYTSDNNGSWGIGLIFDNVMVPENPLYANGNNPWKNIIFPAWMKSGEASGNVNGPIYTHDCLGNIPANDIEIIEINPNLP